MAPPSRKLMSNRWNKDNFIADVEYDKDQFKIIHATDVDPYLKSANSQRLANFHDNQGFSQERNMRKIASIPPLEYTRWIKEDPELAQNPNKLIRKIKEMKSKGLDYTTVDRI